MPQVEQQTRIAFARQSAATLAAFPRTAASIPLHSPSSAVIGGPLNLNYREFVLETTAQAVFNAIERFYLNQSSLRDERIAERLTNTSYWDALAEDEKYWRGL